MASSEGTAPRAPSPAAAGQYLVEITLRFSKAWLDGQRPAEVLGRFAPPALLGEREPQVVVGHGGARRLALKASW